MGLTVTNERLIDLYKIPIRTDDNETAEKFIRAETDRRVKEAIVRAKFKLKK